MRQPIELRASGGVVLIGPLSMVPPLRRGMQSPLAALSHIFQDRSAVAQLRRAWPQLEIGGGHHHQSAPHMHDILEQAIALHRIMLLWIPSVSHHAIHVTIPPKPVAPPVLPRGNAPLQKETAPPPIPVGKLAIPAKVERALLKSFDYIARDGKKGMKDFVKTIEALAKDPVALAKIVAFCALLAVPVVGEAAAGAFLAYAYYLLGFHGTLAALHFGAACVRAAAATTDAEIDAAAREFADAFEDLGEAVIAWLMTRIQPMSSVGARAGAAEKETAIVAKAETQAAKVVKTEETYQTKVLSKYKEARAEAKTVIKTKEEEVAFSPLVDGGGLMAHENAGGHLIEKHIGKTEAELLDRLAAEPGISGSSSFYDRASAERAVSDAIDANKQKISDWLTTSSKKLPIDYTGSNPTGISVSRGAGEAVDVSSTKVILVRDPSLPTGYRVQTGFPTKP